MPSKLYALVDCNSFFCSCERLFRPDLKNKPVGVLSNNDGCFVSRTPELKNLGVKMGAPYFKVKDLCTQHDVAVFSSNFSLYTNMSDRVMSTLMQFAPEIEVYSVDEAFLDLSTLTNFDIDAYAREIKDIVERDTGIPVSIGIGRTKTLAKIANRIAKKSEKAKGVVVLDVPKLEQVALERVEVEDIWGIGDKSKIKLKLLGIKTAKDFRDYDNDKKIQQLLTKTGRQTQDELRGISCFELEVVTAKKKDIMCSRTFGTPVFDLKALRESIAGYASDAAEKLRKQGSLCYRVEVFFRTDHRKDNPQYYASEEHKMLTPTSDTRKIIKYAWSVLDDLYKLGYEYKKAGVKLSGLVDLNEGQISMFEKPDSKKSQRLMKTMDRVNFKEGYSALKSAACGTTDEAWAMNRRLKSPRYTTSINEIPRVN